MQHEELAGREGIAAPGESAADAAGAEAAKTGFAAEADAPEPGAATPLEESDVAAAAEVTEAARERTQAVETAGGVSVAETAAASDGGLISPSALSPTAPLLPVGGGLAAEEVQTVPLAESPSPLGTVEIAAIVTGATRRQGVPSNEETAPTAAESAGTSAAGVAANRQGHGRAGSDRPGPGTGAAACAARGKTGKKLRVQPAPRRPGVGLGPGVPGPLLGWLLQGQPPPAQGHPPPSGERGMGENAAANQEAAGSDDANAGGEYEPSEEHASEECSLEDEMDERTREARRREDAGTRTGRRNQPAVPIVPGPTAGGVPEPSARSPSDLAEDDAIWQQAATWDPAQLQRGDQPFLVRRLPPQVLDSYTLCILAPLL
ncbi:unnamed protein product [Closterium sp. Naga37s-1]|nr:unnamed protein product [Closterium sp. Naga37s-1]